MNGPALALLAAGQSARFGADDKLAAPFRGAMLGLHAANALSGLAAAPRWAIVRGLGHPCIPGWRDAGFDPVVNAQADEGMAASLRLAARLAAAARAPALMICLADMPLVPAAHYAALVDRWRAQGGTVGSCAGALVSPPAIFPTDRFAALGALSGDRGAKALLAGAALVESPPGTLADIDNPETLARLAT
ncbi:NTP transferase domain-containing protein [Novosphingobium sp. ZN18A2]|uniref:NTP transferase domain-containing protein n=1 Tax=Novosphingobium sp. ZN18A2 TaxID=3079861 RepID=UPI0030CA998C